MSPNTFYPCVRPNIHKERKLPQYFSHPRNVFRYDEKQERFKLYRIFGFGFLVSFLFVTLLSAEPLRKQQARNAAARHAVCNDGSPAIYYFRRGHGNGSRNWSIFLVGGGFCWSVDSCNQRKEKYPQLMTSRGMPPSLEADGILSDSATVNPDFYNANSVVIHYCSSDLWSGDRSKSPASGGYHFRGSRIVQAVVEDLLNESVVGLPNLTSAQKVLLSGTSAGGAGVMMHLDWLEARIPFAQVKGINDAGWTPEMVSIIPVLNPLHIFLQQASRFWNGKVDASCGAANPNSRSRCYLSSVYPYIEAPLLVQQSQYDVWVLNAIGVKYPFNFTEKQIADLYASAVRKSLIPVHAAFSPRTLTHGLLPYSRFYTLSVRGITLRRVVANWFFHRNGRIKVIQ
jgi:hypothetical protein